MNVYKIVFHEVCVRFDGAEARINKKIEEICCQEKLPVEGVINFVYERLRFVVSF